MVCSHGDVIPSVIDALVRRGALVLGEPNWRKGSSWALVRDRGRRVCSVEATPPPDPAAG